MLKTAFALLLLLAANGASAATEIISLNWRAASELLPTVQAMLEGDERVSAYGQQLILMNATPAKIRELRALLGKLDTRPRRLLISVDRGQSQQDALSAFSAGGRISAGNTQIQIGEGQGSGKSGVRIIQRSTAGSSASVQQVQATEGHAALIQSGQSVPLNTTYRDAYGKTHETTEYRDLNQGFYLTATVSGDQVLLDISSQNDRASGSGQIQLEQVATRVAAPLGQWIDLGSIGSQSQGSGSDILQKHSGQGSSDMRLRVKVELLD